MVSIAEASPAIGNSSLRINKHHSNPFTKEAQVSQIRNPNGTYKLSVTPNKDDSYRELLEKVTIAITASNTDGNKFLPDVIRLHALKCLEILQDCIIQDTSVERFNFGEANRRRKRRQIEKITVQNLKEVDFLYDQLNQEEVSFSINEYDKSICIEGEKYQVIEETGGDDEEDYSSSYSSSNATDNNEFMPIPRKICFSSTLNTTLTPNFGECFQANTQEFQEVINEMKEIIHFQKRTRGKKKQHSLNDRLRSKADTLIAKLEEIYESTIKQQQIPPTQISHKVLSELKEELIDLKSEIIDLKAHTKLRQTNSPADDNSVSPDSSIYVNKIKTLIVQCNDSDSSEFLENIKHINCQVNPKSIKQKSNHIEIVCKDDQDKSIIQQALENENIPVKEKLPYISKFIFFNVPTNCTDDVILSAIADSLGVPTTHSHLQIIRSRPHRYRNDVKHLIVGVKKQFAKILLTHKYICLGLQKIFFKRFIFIKRCEFCQVLYHRFHKCSDFPCCAVCSGNHQTDNCSSTIENCINCQYAGNNTSDHPANSKSCPTFWQYLKDTQLSILNSYC